MSRYRRESRTRDRELEELYTTLYEATIGMRPKQSLLTVQGLLHIPKLSTRSGLRETHKHIAELSRKLEYVYTTAHARDGFPLVNAILSVWASMCSDGVLCGKLFNQALVSQVGELLAVDKADQRCLLKLFSLIVRHGGESVKVEILREHVLQLVVVLEQYLHDFRASEFAVVAISHCYEAIYPPFTFKDPPGTSDGALELAMDSFIKLFRRYNPSHNVILHGLPTLMLGARVCPWDMIDDIIPTLQLFCAMTRSENINLRCAAMWVLLGVYPKDLENDTPYLSPDEYNTVDDLSADTRATLEDYGLDRCETTLLTDCTDLFVEIVWKFLEDDNRSLYNFGTEMANVLVRGRYVYHDGDIPDYRNSVLPFDDWVECMHAAAQVLRQEPHGKAEDLDRADVLDLEYLIMSKPPEEVEAFARKVMGRNPEHVYAHVTFCMRAAKPEEVLQVAQRGLELPDISPYLRRYLLMVLMDRNIAKAWTLLLEGAPTDVRRRQVGTEALLAGLQYAEVVLREAPPDSLDLLRVLNTYILNVIAARGPESSKDLSELKPTIALLERTENILEEFGYELPCTQRTEACALLLQNYPGGVKNWLAFVRRFDRLDGNIRTSPDEDEEADTDSDPDSPSIERWWDRSMGATLKTLVHGPLRCSCRSGYHGRVDMGPGLVGMYRCSSCGTMSALVKRCGCHAAWYCNIDCQRAHWQKHKTECRKRRAA